MNRRKFIKQRLPNFKTNLLLFANLKINQKMLQIIRIVVLIKQILRDLNNQAIIRIFPILKKKKTKTSIDFKIIT